MPEEPKRDAAGNDSVGTKSAGPGTREKPASKPPSPLPPYKVILHNDDKNYMEDVVRAICQLTSLNEQDAILRTIEADRTGCALLLVTHKERAELYVEQFASCGLTVTAEPDA